jgi:hypothetical protein
MSFPQPAGGMTVISGSILDDAMRIAEDMKKTDKVISPIQSNSGAEICCVTSDQNLVTGIISFEVSGVTYYVGQRKP